MAVHQPSTLWVGNWPSKAVCGLGLSYWSPGLWRGFSEGVAQLRTCEPRKEGKELYTKGAARSSQQLSEGAGQSMCDWVLRLLNLRGQSIKLDRGELDLGVPSWDSGFNTQQEPRMPGGEHSALGWLLQVWFTQSSWNTGMAGEDGMQSGSEHTGTVTLCVTARVARWYVLGKVQRNELWGTVQRLSRSLSVSQGWRQQKS